MGRGNGSSSGLGQTAGKEEEDSRGLLKKWKNMKPKERIFLLLGCANGGRNLEEVRTWVLRLKRTAT